MTSASVPAAFAVKDPWDDRAWLNGWYTAAVCIGQQTNASSYTPSNAPKMPLGTWVKATGDLNNYISYGTEGVSYNEPYVYAYSCNCDAHGCSICYECRYNEKYTTIAGMGYTTGAWDLEKYQTTLKSFALNNVNYAFIGDNKGVKSALENARSRYAAAQTAYENCKGSDSYEPTQQLAATYGDSHTKRYFEFSQVLAFLHPKMLKVAGAPCSVSVPAAPNGPACKSYPLRWKETSRGALDALGKSFMTADARVQELKTEFNRLDFAGICAGDYRETPKATCDEAKSAVATITSGRKEATYGQLTTATERKTEMQKKAYCFPPDFSDYSATMELLWKDNSGFIPLVLALKQRSTSAFSEANAIYTNRSKQANERSAALAKKKIELDGSKLNLIKEAVITNGFDEKRIGTIAERVARFSTTKVQADTQMKDAGRAYAKKQKNYLRDATVKANAALALYSGMENEADLILSDASMITETKRQAAEVLTQQAGALYQRGKNEKVGSYYKQAQAQLTKAAAAKTIGEKYTYYAAAATAARMALNNGNILENETMPLVSQLDDLVRRAEMDEINVASEKESLNAMKQSKKYDTAALQRIFESIIRKADLKYGDLSDIKAELMVNITASQDCGSDLASDVQRADKGFVTAAGIDYMNALGSLKKIREEYGFVSEALTGCEIKMLLSDLRIDSSVRTNGSIKLDKPGHLSVTLLVMNLGTRIGRNLDMPVALSYDGPLAISDIRAGKDRISAIRLANRTNVFTVTEIRPLRTFSVQLEKDVILAKTLATKRTGIGKSDGSVDVTEEKTIETYAAGNLETPLGTGVLVDGGAATAVNIGQHTLVSTYNLKEGYERTEQVVTTKLGTSVQVEKKITLLPKTDITTMPFAFAVNYPEVSGLTVTADGATIANKQCDVSGCALDLAGLKEGNAAKILVSFTVLDATANLPSTPVVVPKIDDCLGSGKNCGALPADLNTTIEDLNTAIKENDTATAIELKEKAEAEIAEWQREQEKTYNELMELKEQAQTELEELQVALANNSTNSSLYEALTERKEELEGALDQAAAATSITDEVAVLKNIAGETTTGVVSDFLEESWKKYNDLKVRLAEAGVQITPQEFIDVESQLGELELAKDPQTALKLTEALAAAEKLVADEEQNATGQLVIMEQNYAEIKANVTALLSKYASQNNEAKGSEWEGLFSLDTVKIDGLLQEIDQYIAEKNIGMVTIKLEQLQKKQGKIEEALAAAKDEAENMLATVRDAFEDKKQSLTAELADAVGSQLTTMLANIGAGKYIQALKIGKEVLTQLTGYTTETFNPLLAVLAVVTVGAAVGVYYWKKTGNENSGGGINLPLLKKKKKEFRKLARSEE
ncbi:MAG: hypothetical protein V1492_05885 [Candidatus Micrarchaeota archaeon]